MIDQETVSKHWATALFLLVLIIAAFTGHAGALNIKSSDKVDISQLVDGNKSTWEKMESGDVASVKIDRPTAMKFTITGASEKEKVEPVVLVNPTSDLVLKSNFAGNEIDFVQADKNRLEGYYSYGKSSSYPWGIYWAINDIGGKPVLVYAEFSKRSTYYMPISYESALELKTQVEKGEIPSLVTIQKVAGI